MKQHTLPHRSSALDQSCPHYHTGELTTRVNEEVRRAECQAIAISRPASAASGLVQLGRWVARRIFTSAGRALKTLGNKIAESCRKRPSL